MLVKFGFTGSRDRLLLVVSDDTPVLMKFCLWYLLISDSQILHLLLN